MGTILALAFLGQIQMNVELGPDAFAPVVEAPKAIPLARRLADHKRRLAVFDAKRRQAKARAVRREAVRRVYFNR